MKKEIKTYNPEDHQIFHQTNPKEIKKRLDGFYGQVAKVQDKQISNRIYGKKILDVGCGYGYLIKNLKEQGFDVCGIEPAPKEILYARKWWNIEIIEGTIYNTPFQRNQFDTLILRDVIFHLDMEEALPEIFRINKKRVIVFMGNTGWLLTFSKWILKHQEHNIRKVEDYISVFENNGYECLETTYSDFFAFPLSGGYISKPLVPGIKWLRNFLLWTDKWASKILGRFGLKKWFAFRVMMVFEKREEKFTD
jgi:SAM-dependent methyltransferase